jgi:hypothetical protein
MICRCDRGSSQQRGHSAVFAKLQLSSNFTSVKGSALDTVMDGCHTTPREAQIPSGSRASPPPFPACTLNSPKTERYVGDARCRPGRDRIQQVSAAAHCGICSSHHVYRERVDADDWQPARRCGSKRRRRPNRWHALRQVIRRTR